MSDIMIHASNCTQITCISNVFIDSYMKEANGEYVKIYLYLLRCLGQQSEDLSVSSIADALEHTEKDIHRALTYWQDKGLLTLEYDRSNVLRGICLLDPQTSSPSPRCSLSVPSDGAASVTLVAEENPHYHAVSSGAKASREISKTNPASAAAGSTEYSAEQLDHFRQNEEIRELLFIAERYMGHTLSYTDMQTIIYWYDGLSLSTDLIEYLIAYCVDKGHASIHYMNKVALNWAESNFKTVEEARQSASIHSQSYYAVMKAFGISGRNLAASETVFVEKWTKKFGFTLDIITEACKRTILNIHKPNFEYADTILCSWQKNGIHHLEDIARLDASHTKEKTGSQKKEASVSVSKQNRFHNFHQREYDYDALERQLLQQQLSQNKEEKICH